MHRIPPREKDLTKQRPKLGRRKNKACRGKLMEIVELYCENIVRIAKAETRTRV